MHSQRVHGCQTLHTWTRPSLTLPLHHRLSPLKAAIQPPGGSVLSYPRFQPQQQVLSPSGCPEHHRLPHLYGDRPRPSRAQVQVLVHPLQSTGTMQRAALQASSNALREAGISIVVFTAAPHPGVPGLTPGSSSDSNFLLTQSLGGSSHWDPATHTGDLA